MVLRTGCWFKVQKGRKVSLPLYITKNLNVKEGEAIELCLGPKNEIILEKYKGEN